jgi:Na+/proline symporter
LAALASLVLLPNVKDIDAYPTLIVTVLPSPLRGLLVAGLLAAFISTINTQLNWGASYLTRDVYVRLRGPKANPKSLMWVARATTLGLMVLGAGVSYYIGSIEKAWKFLALLGAGSGLVLVGRWLWWRINAWSEITVLGTALACGVALRVVLPRISGAFPLPFAFELPLVVVASTAAWLTVTLLTRPVPREKLREFYRLTRPPGPGWRTIAAECGLRQPRGALPWMAAAWALGITFVFSGLFGIGDFLLLRPLRGGIMTAICAAASVGFYFANQQAGRKMKVED